MLGGADRASLSNAWDSTAIKITELLLPFWTSGKPCGMGRDSESWHSGAG